MMRFHLIWAGVAVLGLALAGTVRGEPEGATVITSKQLTYDYQRSVAVFEGEVLVVDPEVRMEADRMNVTFAETNAIKSVAASGNVRVVHADKSATCDRAVYVADTGEVVLRGNADLKQANDRVMGDEITFWLHEERMTCTPGKLIIGPRAKGASEGGGRANILGKAGLLPTTPAARSGAAGAGGNAAGSPQP
jgi:lipopolysaccharide transport protein LptA